MKAAPRPLLGLEEISHLIEPDLNKVEVGLERQAQSAIPLVADINSYLHKSGGKRLRPALLLLCSRLCGFQGEAAVRLGVVVELIHVATLVHDDIIDNAQVRRGRPSVNAQWGNQITVLMGDWLYMTSFFIALKMQNFRILEILIDVTRQMVEGELLQLQYDGQADISVDLQLEICRRKTAHLFSACGRLAALLGKLDRPREEQLASYGHALGMAFQLTDDLLDYTAEEEVLGKPVLKDLEEGKVTLPIILLLQRVSASEREYIHSLVRKKFLGPSEKEEVIEMVRRHGTLEEVRRIARQYVEQAKEQLGGFPDSLYRDALLSIPDFVLQRDR